MELEYVKDTIRNIQATYSQMNEGKFGMEEAENCVQSVVSISAICGTA